MISKHVMISKHAYHTDIKRATEAAAGINQGEKEVDSLEAQLAAAKERLANQRQEQSEAQWLLKPALSAQSKLRALKRAPSMRGWGCAVHCTASAAAAPSQHQH